MDLGNPVDIVVYHILIERMTCLSHQDGFLITTQKVLFYSLKLTVLNTFE